MGRDGLLSCVERIAPTVMVGVPKAMIATVLFAKFRSLRRNYRRWWYVAVGWCKLQDVISADDSPVNFTNLDDEASICSLLDPLVLRKEFDIP